MIKYAHEKQKAIRFTVNIKGNVEEYAMSFLHIFNNARDNHDEIYKVENFYDNRVFVTVNPSCKDEAERYLSQFGEITSKEEITLYIIGFGAGSNWDEVYSDDEKEFILEWDMNI